ncbi:hypothetical protein J9345_20790 [Bacillus subtilis subsp. subtilis]|uniref:hypothetical protein n=1 Tax=Bacillus subtilis TaxID=1423 RepID=UPI001AEC9E64|nr:hypothetical protein [Bacillus subtilis]MBP3048947.1 hypothetical protein [Bacillus subtilis subsp. subtilis]
MAFISLCLKSFDTFKQGSFHTCYHKNNSVFLKLIDSDSDSYNRIDTDDFDKNFKFFWDIACVYFYLSEERKENEFIEKVLRKLPFPFCKKYRSPIQTVEQKIRYEFRVGYKKLLKIHKNLLPLYLLEKENPELLFQFSKSIDYSLKTLEDLCVLNSEIDVDLDKEVAVAAELFNEIYLFHKEIKINDTGEDQVKDFLEKHHAIMKNATDHIKLFRSL